MRDLISRIWYDPPWLSKTRRRLLPHAHEKLFAFILKLFAQRGLMKGERIVVDGSTTEGDGALRAIARRGCRETYLETRMDNESGVANLTIDGLIRLDCKRKDQKLSIEI